MTKEVTDAMAPKSWLGGLEAEKCPYDTPKGKRGDLRIIYSDDFTHIMREMEGQVCALIGPIGKHISHPELQDALALVAIAFNRRHGRLTFGDQTSLT